MTININKCDINNDILSSHKKNYTTCKKERWMKLELIMLNEINQAHKGKFFSNFFQFTVSSSRTGLILPCHYQN